MFGHDYVTVNAEMVPTTNSFQCLFKDVSPFCVYEERLALITGEGDEVGLSGVLVALKRPGHTPV